MVVGNMIIEHIVRVMIFTHLTYNIVNNMMRVHYNSYIHSVSELDGFIKN